MRWMLQFVEKRCALNRRLPQCIATGHRQHEYQRIISCAVNKNAGYRKRIASSGAVNF